MGNRAIVICKYEYDSALEYRDGWATGMYIHWADREELDKWLQRMEREGYRSFTTDFSYAVARLCQVACEEYIDGLNIGIVTVNVKNDPSHYGLDEGYWIVDGYQVVQTIEPRYHA